MEYFLFLNIEDIFIAPEGYGAKVEALQAKKEKVKLLMVDIGGGTSDAALFDEGAPWTEHPR